MHYATHSFVDQKNEIGLSVTRTILTQVEKKLISFEQSQEMAQYVLGGIDKTTTAQALLEFLQKLTEKWDLFATIYELFRLRLREQAQIEHSLKQAQDALAKEV